MIPIKHRDLEKLAQMHWEAVKKREVTVFTKKDFDNVEKWFEEKELSFENVVKASPKELAVFAKNLRSDDYSPEIKKLIDLYENFAKSTTQFGSKENPYNAYHLVKDLGISVCPYCNRNYIVNIDEKNKKRTSELDHFFPKEKYPFLAVSFYNLIPSSKVCNKLKLEKEILLNPYDKDFYDKNLLKFGLKIKDANFYHDKNSIEVRLTLKEEIMKGNCEVFSLQSLYNTHKDQVLELIQKQIVYSDEYIDDLFSRYEGTLFKNREDVIRHISGNYVDEDNFHLRPLSKLTHDIAQELGLID